jgi:hypothetical protein
MAMKKLVVAIGAIAGLAIAAWLILSPQPAEVARVPAAASEIRQAPDRAAATLTPDESAQHAAIEPQAPTRSREPALPSNAPDVPTAARSAQATRSEEQQVAACEARWDRRRAGELAAREAETKDPAWAYAMEQKLREWGTRRLQRAAIELVAVDCKTTYCDLVAQAFEPEAGNEFSRALQDATQEPWNDFSGLSFGPDEEAGKGKFRGELRRQRSYVTPFEELNNDQENQACFRVLSQRAERERAVREAEPRDAAWADQMEQLLRQHITSRLLQHPVQQLDIDCKATFCRIIARGNAPQSRTIFRQAAHEAAAEPWAGLRVGEDGGGSIGDDWSAYMTLHRQ